MKRNLDIEITQIGKRYYVSIKPHDQEKQIFWDIRVKELYRQILRFVMGYLTGQSEKQPMSYTKLCTILTTLPLVFDVDIDFSMR